MANIVIGKVAPLFRGKYSDGTTYNKLDVVELDGSSWVCIEDNIKGHTPDVSTKWKLVAKKGDNGVITDEEKDIIIEKIIQDYIWSLQSRIDDLEDDCESRNERVEGKITTLENKCDNNEYTIEEYYRELSTIDENNKQTLLNRCNQIEEEVLANGESIETEVGKLYDEIETVAGQLQSKITISNTVINSDNTTGLLSVKHSNDNSTYSNIEHLNVGRDNVIGSYNTIQSNVNIYDGFDSSKISEYAGVILGIRPINENDIVASTSIGMSAEDEDCDVVFDSNTNTFFLEVRTSTSGGGFVSVTRKYYTNWKDADRYGTVNSGNWGSSNKNGVTPYENKLYLSNGGIYQWKDNELKLQIPLLLIGGGENNAFSGKNGSKLLNNIGDSTLKNLNVTSNKTTGLLTITHSSDGVYNGMNHLSMGGYNVIGSSNTLNSNITIGDGVKLPNNFNGTTVNSRLTSLENNTSNIPFESTIENYELDSEIEYLNLSFENQHGTTCNIHLGQFSKLGLDSSIGESVDISVEEPNSAGTGKYIFNGGASGTSTLGNNTTIGNRVNIGDYVNITDSTLHDIDMGATHDGVYGAMKTDSSNGFFLKDGTFINQPFTLNTPLVISVSGNTLTFTVGTKKATLTLS